MGDLQRVGAPEEIERSSAANLHSLGRASGKSQRLRSTLIAELRKRLNTLLRRPNRRTIFFMPWVDSTYDLDLLGRDLDKPGQGEARVEESRRKVFLLANSFCTQCAAISELQGAGALLPVGRRQSSPENPTALRDGTTLQKLSDEIGVGSAPRIADLALTSWLAHGSRWKTQSSQDYHLASACSEPDFSQEARKIRCRGHQSATKHTHPPYQTRVSGGRGLIGV